MFDSLAAVLTRISVVNTAFIMRDAERESCVCVPLTVGEIICSAEKNPTRRYVGCTRTEPEMSFH